MSSNLSNLDRKEVELLETLFVRHIEDKVFRSIVCQALRKIDGISLVEAGLIDSWFSRDATEGTAGIFVDQDQKNHSVSIKLEINVAYGVSLPEKAEEVQNRVAEEVSGLTGLHVSMVHLVFKNLIPSDCEREAALSIDAQ